MTILLGQMLGCLLIAAGIGGVVGWLVRHLSIRPLLRQFAELNATLRTRDQALDTAQYELRVRTSATQIMESKVIATEALARSAQKDLAAKTDRLAALQAELSTAMHRVEALETELNAWHQQATSGEAAAAMQMNQITHLTAMQEETRALLARHEQDLHDRQQRITQLEGALMELDRLRARIEELEPAQGRVHWLEVQLSEKDAHHRTVLLDLEKGFSRCAQRIQELEPLEEQLREQTWALCEWERRHADALERHAKECAGYEERLAWLKSFEARLAQQQQASHDKDRQIRTLKQELQEVESLRAEVANQTRLVGEKEEEINQLRTRLVEARAALRIRTNGGTLAPHPTRQAGHQLALHIGPSKSAKEAYKDDLTKIYGIGPAVERVLNKMGVFTFRTIAQWNATELKRMAEKLATDPDRIKRAKWITEAKKEHFRKYGERL